MHKKQSNSRSYVRIFYPTQSYPTTDFLKEGFFSELVSTLPTIFPFNKPSYLMLQLQRYTKVNFTSLAITSESIDRTFHL